jgi:hypothetical protein
MFVAEGCCGECVSVGGVCGGDDGSRGHIGLAVAVLVIIIIIIVILLLVVMIAVAAECESLLESPLLQRFYSYEVQITKLYLLSKWLTNYQRALSRYYLNFIKTRPILDGYVNIFGSK